LLVVVLPLHLTQPQHCLDYLLLLLLLLLKLLALSSDTALPQHCLH
jgi:hypothetical protein